MIQPTTLDIDGYGYYALLAHLPDANLQQGMVVYCKNGKTRAMFQIALDTPLHYGESHAILPILPGSLCCLSKRCPSDFMVAYCRFPSTEELELYEEQKTV